jgi:Calcineurin-like phosphoesterase superfamily domain
VRILAFSDLHRDLGQAAELVAMADGADVVIGAGDFASVHEGLEETIGALAGIEKPTVLVPGNNETDEALRKAAAGWNAATVLHGGGATIEGAEFYDSMVQIVQALVCPALSHRLHGQIIADKMSHVCAGTVRVHPKTRVCGWRAPDQAGQGRREAE